MMKKIWNFLVAWGDAFYVARQAAHLSRHGHYEQAKELLTKTR